MQFFGSLTDRKRGKFRKGSYTVEAAVVFSLTFFVLGTLLIISFYVHDRAVLQAMVCEGTAAGSNFITQKERSAATGQIRKQIREARFMGSQNLKGTISAGNREVTASWKAVYPVPGFGMKYLTGNRLPVSAGWTSTILEPAETIRKVRGAGEFLTGGDDK